MGPCRILPPDGAQFIIVFSAKDSQALHFQGTNRNHFSFMTLISWVLMLLVLPRPKSYSALLRGHLAFPVTGSDRILVRLVVHISSD